MYGKEGAWQDLDKNVGIGRTSMNLFVYKFTSKNGEVFEKGFLAVGWIEADRVADQFASMYDLEWERIEIDQRHKTC
jgi:hypothetical protein